MRALCAVLPVDRQSQIAKCRFWCRDTEWIVRIAARRWEPRLKVKFPTEMPISPVCRTRRGKGRCKLRLPLRRKTPPHAGATTGLPGRRGNETPGPCERLWFRSDAGRRSEAPSPTRLASGTFLVRQLHNSGYRSGRGGLEPATPTLASRALIPTDATASSSLIRWGTEVEARSYSDLHRLSMMKVLQSTHWDLPTSGRSSADTVRTR